MGEAEFDPEDEEENEDEDDCLRDLSSELGESAAFGGAGEVP